MATKLNDVLYAQDLHLDRLAALPNVNAVATGYREVKGKLTDEIVVQVFVDRKIPAHLLSAGGCVPKELSGFKGARIRTDVIESPIDEAQQDTTRYRPVLGGCSIGRQSRNNAGTLGGWACDATDETTVLLSNNHVISNLDTMPAVRGIVQPGRFDGGVVPDDLIGQLKRHIALATIPNPPAPPFPALQTTPVDAAIGTITEEFEDRVIGVGPAIYELQAPALGMQVQKRGRTTFMTTNGSITSINMTVTVSYRGGTRLGRVANSFRILSTDGNPFSRAGDSGSLIFNQEAGTLAGTLPVVGLLYAGGSTDAGPHTTANDINAVFNALDLETICTCVARAIIRGIFGGGAVESGSGIEAARRTERQLRTLRREMRRSAIGKSIDAIVTREAGRVGNLMIKDPEVFHVAQQVLVPFVGKKSTWELLQSEIGDETIEAVSLFHRCVADRDPKLGKVLGAVPLALRAVQGRRIGDVLRAAGKEPSKGKRKK